VSSWAADAGDISLVVSLRGGESYPESGPPVRRDKPA
jgi:hypothetical protein